MNKGISPIVAVVLLIAIAVISAVGLYFWVGGLATKQPTPNTPIVITAIKAKAPLFPGWNETQVTGLLVQNLGTEPLHLDYITDNNVKYYYIHSSENRLVCYFGDSTRTTGVINPGEQALCSVIHTYGHGGNKALSTTTFTGKVAFYGNGTSSVPINLINATIGNITYSGAGGGNEII
jgi:flagellin-like protein